MIYYRIHNGIKDGKPLFKIIDKNESIVTDKEVLEYIKNLVIPPAYKDVKIFYELKPKILFEGFDDKGRKQQIYSQEHKIKASKKKFCNVLEFGRVLPKIEQDINKHLKNKKYTKDKIIALIIKIVMICGFRIGNLKYQKLYNSFGISNILKKHITAKPNKMNISFIGKKGVLNECVVKDAGLIGEINNLINNKSPKDYVFYYIENGETFLISALDINNWLKSYHPNITSKMFRTFDTNILFIEFMRKHAINPTDLSDGQRKKVSIESLKVISGQINNTPTICKKEYLHIDLLTLFLEHPAKFKKYFYGCLDARACFLNYLDKICN